MRRLVVSEFVTLDGVMEAPGGEPTHRHTGWVGDLFGPEHEAHKMQEVLDAESLLLGRVTYESFAGAWPTYEGPFADKMNAMPKHIVSSTMTSADWNNTTIVGGDAVAAARTLKDADGGEILVNGSCALVHTLLLAGLVDELRLMVFPVTIGSGLRLFPETTEKLTFTLARTQTFTNGIAELTYHPAA